MPVQTNFIFNFFSTVLIISSLVTFQLFPNQSFAKDNLTNKQKLIIFGKQIYQKGILPNGNALIGSGAGNIELTGAQASCIRCHRRSGFGSSEGDLRISPILGDILYSERNKSYQQWNKHRTKGQGARPAYTDNTLIKAITKGLDPDKRVLNSLMPRYQLTATEANAIVEYLKSLTLKTEPGITKNEIHIATIYTTDVAKQSQKTMLDLLNIYIKDVNANTRREKSRASNSPWHKKWEYESYRTVILHPWKLTGSQSTWKQQLQRYYHKQKVFTVVNGISNQSWSVINQFCNKTELPCLFPTVELPDLSKNNIYTFYYSGGIVNDAKSIATHIKKMPNNIKKTILQVYRNNEKNNTAAKILKENLLQDNIRINQYVVNNKSSISDTQWTQIIKQQQPNIIIAWLDANDVNALNSNTVNTKKIERFYYSYSHLGDKYSSIIQSTPEKSYLVYRYMLPERKALHMKRASVWAQRKKIDISNDRIIGNSFFAITLLNRSIKKMRAYLKRDYLVEIIESALENNAYNSVYPDLSLGPDQRIASKGAYILGPLSNKDINKKKNHEWIRH